MKRASPGRSNARVPPRVDQPRGGVFSSPVPRIECGNVAIPPNQIVPLKGSVVEVRYLYAMPERHALFRPVFLGVRQDIPETECLLDQLEYKAA